METARSLRVVGGIAVLMLALQAFNMAQGYALNGFGLLPRSLPGLVGILVSPWLHGSWLHLAGAVAGILAAKFLRDRAGRGMRPGA